MLSQRSDDRMKTLTSVSCEHWIFPPRYQTAPDPGGGSAGRLLWMTFASFLPLGPALALQAVLFGAALALGAVLLALPLAFALAVALALALALALAFALAFASASIAWRASMTAWLPGAATSAGATGSCPLDVVASTAIGTNATVVAFTASTPAGSVNGGLSASGSAGGDPHVPDSVPGPFPNILGLTGWRLPLLKRPKPGRSGCSSSPPELAMKRSIWFIWFTTRPKAGLGMDIGMDIGMDMLAVVLYSANFCLPDPLSRPSTLPPLVISCVGCQPESFWECLGTCVGFPVHIIGASSLQSPLEFFFGMSRLVSHWLGVQLRQNCFKNLGWTNHEWPWTFVHMYM